MKKLRKQLSVIMMAILIVTSLLAVGFAEGEEGTQTPAAEPTGKIIVTNDVNYSNVSIKDETFTAYRILDVKQDQTSHEGYAYTLNSAFVNLFTFNGFKEAFPNANVDTSLASSVYTFISGLGASDLQKFANVVYDYVNVQGFAGTAYTATGTEPSGSANETATFTNLPLGYYVVYGSGAPTDETNTDVITACALDTTSWDAVGGEYKVEIPLKAMVPKVEKKIVQNKGESGEALVDAQSNNIGDTVDFRLTSNVPDMTGYTSYTLKFNDTLSKGLTFDAASLVVKIGDTTLTKDTNYTVTAASGTDGSTAITVEMKNFYAYVTSNNVAADTSITVDYSAKLNSDAVVGSAGNPNAVTLTYSNNPHNAGDGDDETTSTTPEDVVKVYTFKIEIFKYTGELGENSQKALAGAKFEIKASGTNTAIDLIDNADGTYRVATPEEITASTAENSTVVIVTEVVSDTNGNIVISGLKEGDYVITETEAPEGYNKLEAPINVTIAATYTDSELTALTAPAEGAAYVNIADKSGIKTSVLNHAGEELPSTGGFGTTLIYVFGILAIVIAVVGVSVKLLAAKKDR